VLDAAVRMLSGMNRSGAIADTRTMGKLFDSVVERVRSDPAKLLETIPPLYWCVLPADRPGEHLIFRGAVLVRVTRRNPARAIDPDEPAGEEDDIPRKPARPTEPAGMREIFHFLRADGLLRPAVIAGALFLGSATVVAEAIFYRTFLDLSATLTLTGQRIAALALFIAFLLVSIALEWWPAEGLLRAGRKLETRLRAHILHRLPQMPNSYFGSRLVSDMAERAHAIHDIRAAPMLGGRLLRYGSELIVTLLGIAWLDPNVAPLALACAVSSVALPLLFRPVLGERDLRFRTHTGGLCRFYFDALRGLTAVRAHTGEQAMRTEHEGLLVSWTRAGLSLQRIAVTLESAGLIVNSCLVAALVIQHVSHSGPAGALLLVYWALNIPSLGSTIAQVGWQYPRLRNLASRVLEPLSAQAESVVRDFQTTAQAESVVRDFQTSVPESESLPAHAAEPGNGRLMPRSKGVSIEFRGVSVRALGHTILDPFDLTVEAGCHACIVGPSGAGKSTLAGTLLGWHVPATGQIFVDGAALTEASLESLRLQTAWVDPSVQIWNRSLFENIRYGASERADLNLTGEAIERTGLLSLVEKLPDGLQSALGEGGARISGGEAQRVRIARGMMRRSARLVILDEAFTALDRAGRRELLLEAKKIWRDATLIAITHDLNDTLFFDRVLVLEEGRIVEDGPASVLAARSGSRLRAMLEAERAVQHEVWPEREWRRVRLERGQMAETSLPPTRGALPQSVKPEITAAEAFLVPAGLAEDTGP
jgi:ATP-binding cassette subfamily B protein